MQAWKPGEWPRGFALAIFMQAWKPGEWPRDFALAMCAEECGEWTSNSLAQLSRARERCKAFTASPHPHTRPESAWAACKRSSSSSNGNLLMPVRPEGPLRLLVCSSKSHVLGQEGIPFDPWQAHGRGWLHLSLLHGAHA